MPGLRSLTRFDEYLGRLTPDRAVRVVDVGSALSEWRLEARFGVSVETLFGDDDDGLPDTIIWCIEGKGSSSAQAGRAPDMVIWEVGGDLALVTGEVEVAYDTLCRGEEGAGAGSDPPAPLKRERPVVRRGLWLTSLATIVGVPLGRGWQGIACRFAVPSQRGARRLAVAGFVTRRDRGVGDRICESGVGDGGECQSGLPFGSG